VERKAKKRPTRPSEVPILRDFGAAVRVLRKERGWSLERFATEARLHWTYIAGIERGERNLSLINIGKLASALKVPIAELFRHVSIQGRSTS